MNEQTEDIRLRRNRRGLFTSLRVAAFGVVFSFILSGLSAVFMNKVDTGYRICNFYGLKENTLDAVYIGSSRVYSFWTPLFAFRDHGIAVYSLSTAAQPIDAARYLIEEAHKTQPDALMIVNLAPYRGYENPGLHRITDSLPLSFTKLCLINNISERHGIRILDRAEYLFPLILYHSHWQDLKERDFSPAKPGLYMGSCATRNFLTGVTDITDVYPAPVTESAPVEKGAKAVLDDLIDYVEKNDIRILFTLAPQAGVTEAVLKERNGLRDYVRSRGCPVLDMQNKIEEIGLDLSTDYFNARHTNVKGSLKFTEYVANYLIENYGFADKRSDPVYADWQTALENYEALLLTPEKAVSNEGDDSLSD